MKKVFKIFLRIVEVVVIAYVILMSTCLLCRNKYGYTQFGEKTLISIGNKDTKDLKEFPKNSLVVFEEVDTDDIKVGDSVYYYAVKNEKYIITKGKVLEIQGEASDTLYKFEENQDVAVAGSKVIGTSDETYDTLGGIKLFLESRIGFLIFVLLPILLLFIYEIYDLVVTVKYDDGDSDKKVKKKNEPEIETL